MSHHVVRVSLEELGLYSCLICSRFCNKMCEEGAKVTMYTSSTSYTFNLLCQLTLFSSVIIIRIVAAVAANTIRWDEYDRARFREEYGSECIALWLEWFVPLIRENRDADFLVKVKYS